MNKNNTPLRYPGGKSLMTPFFVDLIKANKMEHITYVEPYAGGAGTAINLLLGSFVDRIIINDLNVCLYSFWYFLLHESEKFIDRINSTDVSLKEWRKQKTFINTHQEPSFDLGFATFFLCRTNRSGILNAGPIGGSSEEKQDKAKYKIDCRFNKAELIRRIKNIVIRKDLIEVDNNDAINLLRNIRGNNYLVYLDPPYFEKGKSLYLNFYENKDHQSLADFLSKEKSFSWVLSYNKVNAIVQMYKDFDLYEFPLKYTAQEIKNGEELLTHSRNLVLPENLIIQRGKKNKGLTIKKIN